MLNKRRKERDFCVGQTGAHTHTHTHTHFA